MRKLPRVATSFNVDSWPVAVAAARINFKRNDDANTFETHQPERREMRASSWHFLAPDTNALPIAAALLLKMNAISCLAVDGIAGDRLGVCRIDKTGIDHRGHEPSPAPSSRDHSAELGGRDASVVRDQPPFLP